jgi:hypothetical protein
MPVTLVTSDHKRVNIHDKDIQDNFNAINIEELQTTNDLLHEPIPTDPQKFYEDFGLFEHPLTRKPVKKLTSYQLATWKDSFHYRYRLVVKSQKVGITTSSLLEDFQHAVLPSSHPLSCRGKEILVIAQTGDMAKQHLYTLRKLVMNSQKYRKYLITKATELVLRDEATKVSVMFIRNPENIHKPTRIIALSPTERAVWSWKEVKKVHMSDVAVNLAKDDSGFFGAVFSRLANTNGQMLIETPPRGQRGEVWNIYQASKLHGDDEHEQAKFKVREIPVEMAVDAGIIKQEFLDQERARLGVLYSQLYECNFLNPYTSWYDESYFKVSDAQSLKVGR